MNIALTTELLHRLSQSEDAWVERKQSFNDREVKRTLVAFANSLHEGQTAVLFLGASNDGKHRGLADADETQKKVGLVANGKCYPPIPYQACVLSVEISGAQVEVLAVVVPFSKDRPHFGGMAYIRQGSETKEASRDIFYELIASQNDKARRILQFKSQRIMIRWQSPSGFYYDVEGFIESADAHSFVFRDDSGASWPCSIPRSDIKKDSTRPLIVVAEPPWTEAEHIRKIVKRWFLFVQTRVHGVQRLERDNYLVAQLLANPELAERAVAAEMDGSAHSALKSLLAHVRFELKKITNPMTRIVKQKRLETRFSQLMKGHHPFSNASVIGAAVDSIVEVATSLEEAEEFLNLLCQRSEGVAQVPANAIWNALLWKLGFT